MEVAIQHTWDSDPVDHDPIRISFSDGKSGLRMEVSGPFFNDPAAPPGEPGIAFPGLWNYEGKRKLILVFVLFCFFPWHVTGMSLACHWLSPKKAIVL